MTQPAQHTPGSRPRAGLGAVGAQAPYTAECFLASGSPRLALAKAKCIPFVPWLFTIKGKFPDTVTNIVPMVGGNQRIDQDTYVEQIVFRVVNEGNPNSNTFQTASDFFFGFQSGIEMALTMVGAPRPDICDFTQISALSDMWGGTNWPDPWILSSSQQLKAAFRTTIPLPTSPISVYCVFRCRLPSWNNQDFINMSNRQALDQLQALGFDTCGYDNLGCST